MGGPGCPSLSERLNSVMNDLVFLGRTMTSIHEKHVGVSV